MSIDLRRHGFLLLFVTAALQMPAVPQDPPGTTSREFAREVERALPAEEPYAYHRRLASGPVHAPGRDPAAQPRPGELAIPDKGWTLAWNTHSSPVLGHAVLDFQDYLKVAMGVRVELKALPSLEKWRALRHGIIAGTREQLPGLGTALKGPKDYEIIAEPDRLLVCGYDERGVMFGLYNLEARLNLREGPFLSSRLKTVRHSLYEARLVHSWLGWMDWPDPLLAHLVHDGYDGLFASCYANPNGDRTVAETVTEFYGRLLFLMRAQDPGRMRDLIDRASRFGLKVYAPVIYQYLGTPESEDGLRRLMRDILREFPDIRGYVLLTEGFWYKQWGGYHGASRETVEDWARHWCRAVAIVAEECHKVDPAIEVLPWEYNIDFRPQNAELKRYFIQRLPADSRPLLTWENGKGFELDGLRGHLRDYSLSQVGPAEVTEAQIGEARRRHLKVYSKADAFSSWQYGTVPYLPFPYQWLERYKALEKHGVNGTLESWSTGYTPNFMTRLRAWTCWTDAPPPDELLGAAAAVTFGSGNRERVLRAWDLFSQAIRLVPDTGPNFGTNNAIGNPLFFQEPPPRTVTFNRSWTDQEKWTGYLGAQINPYWPFTVSRMVFYPDFSNATNQAELYARSATGVEAGAETKLLPLFLKSLGRAAGLMEDGLKLYRAAALDSPDAKREQAVREVVIAETLQRMMESDGAILEFEDLRLRLEAEPDAAQAASLLDRLETILRKEIDRTELARLAASRDSRLGFQYEQDYVFTPYSLGEKLALLRETLDRQLPARREAPRSAQGQPPLKSNR